MASEIDCYNPDFVGSDMNYIKSYIELKTSKFLFDN